MGAIVRVDDDGNVSFLDETTEQPLDPALVELAKKQNADSIKMLVSDQVDKINAGLDALATLHTFLPPPVDPKYEKVAFDLPQPPRGPCGKGSRDASWPVHVEANGGREGKTLRRWKRG